MRRSDWLPIKNPFGVIRRSDFSLFLLRALQANQIFPPLPPPTAFPALDGSHGAGKTQSPGCFSPTPAKMHIPLVNCMLQQRGTDRPTQRF